MADEEPLDVNSFALSYRRLAEAVSRVVPNEVAPFAHLLEEHLGRDITELPVVAMSVEVFDQPNLQRALDALGSDDMVDVVRIVGIRGEHRMYGVLSLATLTQSQLRLEIGPVDHVERSIDTDRTLTCIDFGLLLIQVAGNPFALLVRSGDERRGTANLSVKVMGPDRQLGAELLGRIRALMGTHNVFRGKVVSLSPSGPFGSSLEARFVERPHLERADVILPEGVLDRIERITVGFSARAASLRAGGRHLRRGLLLHGPPGTGKTHTVRYLMSRLFDRTVSCSAVKVSGQSRRQSPWQGLCNRPPSYSRTLIWWQMSAPHHTPEPIPFSSSCSTRWTGSKRTPTSSLS